MEGKFGASGSTESSEMTGQSLTFPMTSRVSAILMAFRGRWTFPVRRSMEVEELIFPVKGKRMDSLAIESGT